MKRRFPPLMLLLVLLALVGGGVALSKASRPRVSRTGELVVPIAWTQPVGVQPQMAQQMPAQQMPAQQMPAQQMPAQQMAAQQMAAQQMAAQQMPLQQMPPQQLSPALDRIRPATPTVGNNNGNNGRRVMSFLNFAPAIRSGATPPHGRRGDCKACHRILPPAPVAPPAAGGAGKPCPVTQAAVNRNMPTTASGTKLPYQEAHWQGIEAISLTPGLARVMKISPTAKGVVIDEVTWPADEQGLAAGDLILSVGTRNTPDLESFVDAADRVRDESRVMIEVLRKGEPKKLQLSARRLGNAVGETAPMIPPGARPPHGYMGPCTDCHRIGRGGSLPVDLGDVLSKAAPPIRAGQPRPHLDRGRCSVCHKITQ